MRWSRPPHLLVIVLSLCGCGKQAPPEPTPGEGTPVLVLAKPQDEPHTANEQEAIAANNRGAKWEKEGDYDNALREYDRAIVLDPKLAHAFNNRGLVYLARGEKGKAMADFNKAIQLRPTLAAAFGNRAGLWMRQAQDEKAELWMREAQYDKAVADYDQATRLDPEMAIAFNNRGWIRATCPFDHLRNGEKAVRDGLKAYALSGEKDPAAMSTVAAGYAECGRFDEAIKWQTKALADNDFERRYGERARRALTLYEQGMPYRDHVLNDN
jgi:tetratricopeptide (TPR) repeat protein